MPEKLCVTAYVCRPSTARASSEWRQDNWLEIQGLGGGCSQRSRLNALTWMNAVTLLSSEPLRWLHLFFRVLSRTAISLAKTNKGLGRWLSHHCLLFQRLWVLVPAPTYRLTAIYNPIPSSGLWGHQACIWYIDRQACRQTSHAHNVNNCFF